MPRGGFVGVYGHGLPELMAKATARAGGATVFGYVVTDPERWDSR